MSYAECKRPNPNDWNNFGPGSPHGYFTDCGKHCYEYPKYWGGKWDEVDRQFDIGIYGGRNYGSCGFYKRGVCKRDWNKARNDVFRRLKCCTGVLGSGHKNYCPPEMCPGSSSCNREMKRHCSDDPTRVFTDNQCKIFATTPEGKRWTEEIKAQVCNDPGIMTANNELSKQCVRWCVRNQGDKNNPGVCDRSMNTWCLLNPDSPECKCINSPVKKYNPLCIDAKCATGGYATASMITARGDKCGNIINCEQIINLKAGGDIDILDQVKFDQECGAKAITKQDKPDTIRAPKLTEPDRIRAPKLTEPESIDKGMNTTIIIALIVLVVLLLAAAIIVLRT